MKETPMLYNGEMVRALLRGQKVNTRRPIFPKHRSKIGHWPGITHMWTWDIFGTDPNNNAVVCQCPYGKAGDRIWVRETCRAEESANGSDGVRYLADDTWIQIDDSADAADNWVLLNSYRGQVGASVPSIHMPRWASRILLEITGVRTEQVNEISEGDVIKEGCPNEILYGRGWFKSLWDGLYGVGSWDKKQWVWVIEFKRVAQ